MKKSELRKSYLARRKSIPGPERAECSEQIARHFFASVLPKDARVIHCFVSIHKLYEVDTASIFEGLWRDRPDAITAVPRTDMASGTFESVIYRPQHPLRRNEWGIDEPSHDHTIEPADVDVVVVPLLAYDRSGYRVGYGKGFYDKFLAACRDDCLKVGVSYFPPVDVIDDLNEFDIPLDLCITPETIYDFRSI